MNKKFRSTSGKTERLTLPSGHVALVDISWGELPPMFFQEAYAAGCESEDMVVNKAKDAASEKEQKFITKVFDKKARIKDAIIVLLEKNDVSDFTYYKRTNDYKPKANVITEMIGSRIMNTERDAIWFKMLEDGIPLPEFK